MKSRISRVILTALLLNSVAATARMHEFDSDRGTNSAPGVEAQAPGSNAQGDARSDALSNAWDITRIETIASQREAVDEFRRELSRAESHDGRVRVSLRNHSLFLALTAAFAVRGTMDVNAAVRTGQGVRQSKFWAAVLLAALAHSLVEVGQNYYELRLSAKELARLKTQLDEASTKLQAKQKMLSDLGSDEIVIQPQDLRRVREQRERVEDLIAHLRIQIMGATAREKMQVAVVKSESESLAIALGSAGFLRWVSPSNFLGIESPVKRGLGEKGAMLAILAFATYSAIETGKSLVEIELTDAQLQQLYGELRTAQLNLRADEAMLTELNTPPAE